MTLTPSFSESTRFIYRLLSLFVTFLALNTGWTQQQILWTFDVPAVSQALSLAPLEGSQEAKSTPLSYELPMPDGTVRRFHFERYELMAREFAVAYPDFFTYKVTAPDDARIRGRVTVTPFGVMANIKTPGGMVEMAPLDLMNPSLHRVSVLELEPGNFSCGTDELEHLGRVPELEKGAFVNGTTLKTYSLAIVTTGEFGQTHGGTLASASAVVVAQVAALEALYESELAVNFSLLTPKVYTDPATDPFDAANADRTKMAAEAVALNWPNSADYDIGHCLHSTGGGSWGGGVAYLFSVCDNDIITGSTTGRYKAGAWSSVGSSAGGDLSLFAHEMGHQFNMYHTFNGIGGGCTDNISSSSAYEIGSGTTIMSYNGICNANQNIPSGGDADIYFHTANLETAIPFINSVTCHNSSTATGNTPPVVNANPCSGGVTIPKSTPFLLRGSGMDSNADALLYTWEQIDEDGVGTPTQGFIGATAGASTIAPLFRSYPPSFSPTRTFPSMSLVAANNYSSSFEPLPSVARTVKMQFTARDQRAGGGAVRSATLDLTISETGPFAVTAPNGGGSFAAGNSTTVTWNTTGTTGYCSTVNIRLSVDGGFTFPYTLASETPNDGSQEVTLPSGVANSGGGRIMIECADNTCIVFFDISDTDFNITSTCQAPTTAISPTTPVFLPFGDAGLNLGMTNNVGAIVTSFSGTVSTADPVGNLVFQDGPSAVCTQAGNAVNYDVYALSPDLTGSYTFTHTGPFGLVLNLYQTEFTGTNCTNQIASSATRPSGSGGISLSSAVTATLTAGNLYYLVVSSFSSSTPALPASYSINFTKPSGSSVYNGVILPSGYAYTYVAVNTSNDQVAAVSASSDFTALAGGTYCVYGAAYKASGATPPALVSPAGWVGSTMASILSGGACVLFSTNCRPVTVTPCTPPTVNAGADITTCPEGEVQLNGSVTGTATTGTWVASVPGGVFLPDANTLNAVYDAPDGAPSVTLTLNASGPCPASDQMTISYSGVSPVTLSVTGPASGECGSVLSFPVTVSDFNNMVAFQFSAVWDPAKFEYVSSTVSGLTGALSNLFNSGTLTFVWSTGSSVTLPADATILTLHLRVKNSSGSGNVSFSNTPTAINGWNDQQCEVVINTNASSATTFSPISVQCPANITGICPDGPSFFLSGGTPSGGFFSGPGVSDGEFNPSAAGVGVHEITYNYSSGGCSSSCTFSIEVIQTVNPTLNVATPAQGTICVGQTVSATFSQGTGGIGCSDVYEYRVNSGAWTAYTPGTDITASEPGTVEIRGSRSGCAAGCTEATAILATWNIVPDPAILIQPVGFTQCVGGTYSLSVSAFGGTPSLTYQWQSGTSSFSGFTDIPGANNAFYTPASGSLSTDYYRVVVSSIGSGCTSVTSGSVAVTILPDPAIIAQPQAFTQCVGGTNSLNVSASGGTPSLTYQWQSGTSQFSGYTDIPGANSATYTPASSSFSTDYYRVVVSALGSGCTSATSEPVAVTILPDPAIISQPESFTQCIGGSNSLNVLASGGTPSLTYQWQSGTSQFSGYTDIPGANSATYTPASSSLSTDYYRVVVSSIGSGCTSVTSGSVAVTILPDPAIIAQPQAFTQCVGGTNSLLVSAFGGTPSLTYQWQSGTSSFSGFTDIPGANNASYIPASGTISTNYYRVVVGAIGSGCTSVTSEPVAVTTISDPTAPTIATGTAAGNVCEGQVLAATFSPGLGGTDDCSDSYQYIVNGGIPVPFTASFSYTIGVNETVVLQTRRSCTDFFGCNDTGWVTQRTWTSLTPMVGEATPDVPVICPGGSVTFSASVSGGVGGYTAQWQYTSDGITWANITNGVPAGATYTVTNTTILAVSGITEAGDHQYRLQMRKMGCTTVNGAAGTVSILGEVNPGNQSKTICNNTLVGSFLPEGFVAPSGTTWSWALQGALPSGVTSTNTTSGTGTSITMQLLNTSNEEQVVVFMVTPFAGSIGCENTPFTVTVTVTVNALQIPSFEGIGFLCQGSTAPSLPATSINGFTGTWNPATINTYNPGPSVYVFTPSAGQCAFSGSLSVTIVPFLTPTFEEIGPLCQGSTAPSLPTSSINGISGTWTPATINTASASTTVYAFTPSFGQCATTVSVSVTVNSPPIVTAIAPTSICQGSDIQLTGGVSGSATTGTWTTSGDGIFSGTISNTSVYTPGSGDNAAGIVTLTLTSADPPGQCTPGSASVMVIILPAPLVTLTASENTACAFGNNDISFTTTGGPGVFSTTATSTALMVNGSNALLDVSEACVGIYQVTYAVTNQSGCAASASRVVSVLNCGIDQSGTLKYFNPQGAGTVTTPGIADATVTLREGGTTLDTDISTATGNYQVAHPSGSSFSIIPNKNRPWAQGGSEGVTAADASRILAHVSGTYPLLNPYHLIAANIASGSYPEFISFTDASRLLQSLTGNLPAQFSFQNRTWVFVPESQYLSATTWDTYQSGIEITDPCATTNGNFIGIKLGDLVDTDNNPIPGNDLNLKLTDQPLVQGAQIQVLLRASALDSLMAFQFALGYDPARLTFISATPASDPFVTTVIGTSTNGLMEVAFATGAGVNVSENSNLLQVTFIVTQGGGMLSEALDLAVTGLSAEAYTYNNYRTGEVNLNYETAVSNEITITTQPVGFAQCIGGTNDLFVSTQGCTAGLLFQWQSGFSLSGPFSDIPTATTAVYTPPSNVAGTTYYRVVVSSMDANCTSATSDAVAVDVVPDPVAPYITSGVPGGVVCPGQQLATVIDVGSGGTGDCINEYRYLVNGTPSQAISFTSGTTFSFVIQLGQTITLEARRICDGTACDGDVAPWIALRTWTAATPTVGAAIPERTSVCAGSNVTFSATVSGGVGGYTNEWQYLSGSTWANVVNGVPAGATYNNQSTTSLSVSGITLNGNHQYRLQVSKSGCATEVGAAGAITVIPAPTASIAITENSAAAPNDGVLCSGDNAILVGSATGGTPPYIYFWNTTPPLPLTSISVSTPGVRTVAVSDVNQCFSTASVNIEVIPIQTPVFSTVEPICLDSEAPALEGTSANGITGTWNPVTIQTSTPGISTYTFIPAIGQCAISTNIAVEVLEPVVPLFDVLEPICEGTSPAPELSTTSNNGVPGSWTPVAVNTEIPGTSTYIFIPAPGECATDVALDVTVNPIIGNYTISGKLISYHTNPAGVGAAAVDLSGEEPNNTTTESDGLFSLSFSLAGDYEVAPSKSLPYVPSSNPAFAAFNTHRLNGVDVADVARILQHTSGVEPLDNGYNMIAADVNRNNAVSSVDRALINAALLGNSAPPFNTSWRFVPENHEVTLEPWGFPEFIGYTNICTSQSDQDFIGIKIGDVVSGYANPANITPAEALTWVVQDRTLAANSFVDVDFYPSAFEDLAAFQFALQFDPEVLEFLDYTNFELLPLNAESYGTSRIMDGELRIVFAEPTGYDTDGEVPAFRLRFRVLAGGHSLKDVMYVNTGVMSAVAYNSSLVQHDLRLMFTNLTRTEESLPGSGTILYQNRPNPFSGQTEIRFRLPETNRATLTILDVMGRKVLEQSGIFTSGEHSINLELPELASGIYYYRLTTPSGQWVRKMESIKKY